MRRNRTTPDDRTIWDKAVKQAVKEPHATLTFNREAVREALKESRMRHTVRVRTPFLA